MTRVCFFPLPKTVLGAVILPKDAINSERTNLMADQAYEVVRYLYQIQVSGSNIYASNK
jgi:hypothetical protein